MLYKIEIIFIIKNISLKVYISQLLLLTNSRFTTDEQTLPQMHFYEDHLIEIIFNRQPLIQEYNYLLSLLSTSIYIRNYDRNSNTNTICLLDYFNMIRRRDITRIQLIITCSYIASSSSQLVSIKNTPAACFSSSYTSSANTAHY